MTREYLQAIGDAYKEKYLLDAADYSELLVYKWNTPVEDIDDMVVDIEKLQMDDWDMEGTKFKDWNFYWNSHWAETRYNYVAGKLEMMGDFILTPIYDVDSLQFDLNDGEHRELVYESFVSFAFLFCFEKVFLISHFLNTSSLSLLFLPRSPTTASTPAIIPTTSALSARSSAEKTSGPRTTSTFARPSTEETPQNKQQFFLSSRHSKAVALAPTVITQISPPPSL